MTARTAAQGLTPQRRAIGAALALVGALVAGCGASTPAGTTSLEGLVVLAAGPDGTTLSGWDASTTAGSSARAGTSRAESVARSTAIDAPKRDATWISGGRGGVLAATLADGSIATSDPVVLGDTLTWRPLKLTTPVPEDPLGPAAFATWDPAGGILAALAGDITTGDGVRVIIVDPSKPTPIALAVPTTVVAAPPAWLGKDRLAIVSGDTADPATIIIDTTTLKQTKGPSGSRIVATSADAARVATMAAQGAPVVVRDTDGWLAGDGSSLASIAPPKGARTAICFALDATGQRLAVAWLRSDGSVALGVYAAASDWRSVATPTIGHATGAAVTWLR